MSLWRCLALAHDDYGGERETDFASNIVGQRAPILEGKGHTWGRGKSVDLHRGVWRGWLAGGVEAEADSAEDRDDNEGRNFHELIPIVAAPGGSRPWASST